jgi:serine protease Do
VKSIKIGRKADNDIIVNDETATVSGYHAVLKVYDNGKISICDCSTNGTYINGVKATKDVDVSIKKGDEVRLGPKVLLDWSKVDVSSANIDATEIDTDEKTSYTIGTESDNRIVISDFYNHVSRHHAILKLKVNGSYYIYDQSTNGTYVNGLKIKPKVDIPVTITDTISLSNTYQFDWNKVPNISVPKPIPATTKSRTKIWGYLFYGVIIAGAAYFGYYKSKINSSEMVEQAPRINSIVAPIQITTETQTTIPISKITNTDISTLYEQNKDAVFVVYTSDGTNYAQGSGFFISSSGVAVSNYHVFKGTEKGLESIKTQNGTFKVDSVLVSSEGNDYIIFKVAGNGTTFPCLKIASFVPRVGEDVFAIGAPKGLEHTLSRGIVSSLRGNNSIIQTTTEITHGSSGGPLFNMRGEVIGITSAGLGEADLNFAISIVGMGFEKY